MNRQRMLELADFIEKHPEKFDMEYWMVTREGHVASTEDVPPTPPCGTTACMAGWTYALWPQSRQHYIEDAAAEVLDLTDHEAEQLFYGYSIMKDDEDRDMESITVEEAVAELRRLGNGGEL